MKTVLPLLAEYLATFIFVFSFFAIHNVLFMGLALSVLLFLIAPISGGAMNPLITFGFYLYGKLSVTEASLYVLIQILSTLTAFYTFKILE